MQKTREKMYIMHENEVSIVGEVGKTGLAIENGKLWPNDLRSEGYKTVEISLDTA